MDKIKIAEIVLSFIAAVVAAAKAIVKLLSHMDKTKPQPAEV